MSTTCVFALSKCSNSWTSPSCGLISTGECPASITACQGSTSSAFSIPSLATRKAIFLLSAMAPNLWPRRPGVIRSPYLPLRIGNWHSSRPQWPAEIEHAVASRVVAERFDFGVTRGTVKGDSGHLPMSGFKDHPIGACCGCVGFQSGQHLPSAPSMSSRFANEHPLDLSWPLGSGGHAGVTEPPPAGSDRLPSPIPDQEATDWRGELIGGQRCL